MSLYDFQLIHWLIILIPVFLLFFSAIYLRKCAKGLPAPDVILGHSEKDEMIRELKEENERLKAIIESLRDIR